MELPYPSDTLLAELTSKGKLDETLNLYARIISSPPDSKEVAQWCRKYLSTPNNKALRSHSVLRKAVFNAVFNQKLLKDSSVETYWDIAVVFGPLNESVTVKYLESAPRSVPLKFGRLLNYIAEFGRPESVSLDELEQIITVVFSAGNVASSVLTPEWKKSIGRFKTNESHILLDLADKFAAGGPVQTLVTLFPQLPRSKALALLIKTQLSVEELTQRILDNPSYADEELGRVASTSSTGTPVNGKFVMLNEKEKEARAAALREHNKRHFVYEYVPLEDEDPEPDEDPTAESALSEADKKLASQEELLWSYWQSNKEVFDRSSRKSSLRQQLRKKLQWTDEQVEGWGRVIGSKGRMGEAHLHPTGAHQVEAYAPKPKPIPVHTESEKPLASSIDDNAAPSKKSLTSSSKTTKKSSADGQEESKRPHRSHQQRSRKSGKSKPPA